MISRRVMKVLVSKVMGITMETGILFKMVYFVMVYSTQCIMNHSHNLIKTFQ